MSRVADFARDCGSRGAGRRTPATLPTLVRACMRVCVLAFAKAVDLRTLWGYDEATAQKWLCPCPGPQVIVWHTMAFASSAARARGLRFRQALLSANERRVAHLPNGTTGGLAPRRPWGTGGGHRR